VRLLIEHETPLPAATRNQHALFQWTVTGSGKEKLGVIPDRVFALESRAHGARIDDQHRATRQGKGERFYANEAGTAPTC
jgi:hypothetical protein